MCELIQNKPRIILNKNYLSFSRIVHEPVTIINKTIIKT